MSLLLFQHIFKMEQEEYKREGIDWNEISFVDNKPLLVSHDIQQISCSKH